MQEDMYKNPIPDYISTFSMQLGQLAERVDTGLAFHKDIAVGLKGIQDTMLTKDTYAQDKVTLEARLTTIEQELETIKRQPRTVTEYARVLIPILAILGAMILGSLGLNLTTLIFVINHVTGR